MISCAILKMVYHIPTYNGFYENSFILRNQFLYNRFIIFEGETSISSVGKIAFKFVYNMPNFYRAIKICNLKWVVSSSILIEVILTFMISIWGLA